MPLHAQNRVHSRRGVNFDAGSSLEHGKSWRIHGYAVPPRQQMRLFIIAAAIGGGLVGRSPLNVLHGDRSVGDSSAAGVGDSADNISVYGLSKGERREYEKQ